MGNLLAQNGDHHHTSEMGDTAAAEKVVYIQLDGRIEKIAFTSLCASEDIESLLRNIAKVNKNYNVNLRKADGTRVVISGEMPINNERTAYMMTVDLVAENGTGLNMAAEGGELMGRFAGMLEHLLQFEDFKSETRGRIRSIEKRLDSHILGKSEVDRDPLGPSIVSSTIQSTLFVCTMRSAEIAYLKEAMDGLKTRQSEIGLMVQRKGIDYAGKRPNHFEGDFVLGTDESKISLKRSVPPYAKYTLSKETMEYLKQPTFDIWYWEPNEMLSLLEHMFHDLGIVEEFNIDGVTLKKWLENYRNNPFHNFRHGFCVAQMMYGLIHLVDLTRHLTVEDLGAMVIACVCHDLDHPGFSNTYQINARTELALRYNDISPLENHHCAVTFQILKNPECNILANVTPEVFKRVRSEITSLILATDMSKHGAIMTDFKSCIAAGFNFRESRHIELSVVEMILATDMTYHKDLLRDLRAAQDNLDFEDPQMKQLIKKMLIKSCDISNEVRPTPIAEPWVDCLLEEYFTQAELEKEMGLPVLPHMDKHKVTKSDAQLGFINYILLPMFQEMAKVFPAIQDAMVKPLLEAKDYYMEMNEKDAVGPQEGGKAEPSGGQTAALALGSTALKE